MAAQAAQLIRLSMVKPLIYQPGTWHCIRNSETKNMVFIEVKIHRI